MIVNKSSIQALMRGLNQSFQSAVETAEDERVELLTQTVNASTDKVKFPIGALLGDLEEVLDEVVLTDIGAWVQNVDVRTFARAVRIKMNDIADDNLGVYEPAVRQLGRRAELYPLRLIAEEFVNSFDTDWIDGNTVFYTSSRSWPGGSESSFTNQHNLNLTADNFDTMYEEMESRVGPDGNPLQLTPDYLVCGPSQRANAEDILEVQRNDAGATNRQYGMADIIVLKRITGDQWGLVDADPVPPMALLDRSGPNFIPKDDPDDDEAFYQEQFAYKGRRRCAVATIAPWLFHVSDPNAS